MRNYKIAIIIGSLRKDSINRKIARGASKRFYEVIIGFEFVFNFTLR